MNSICLGQVVSFNTKKGVAVHTDGQNTLVLTTLHGSETIRKYYHLPHPTKDLCLVIVRGSYKTVNLSSERFLSPNTEYFYRGIYQKPYAMMCGHTFFKHETKLGDSGRGLYNGHGELCGLCIAESVVDGGAVFIDVLADYDRKFLATGITKFKKLSR